MRKRTLLVSILLLATCVALAVGLRFACQRQAEKAKRERERTSPTEIGDLFRFPSPSITKKAESTASVSLTASDGTGLKLASLEARGIVQGPLAFTEVRLSFDNPENRTLEGTFRIVLPQGAAVSRFAMRQGSKWQEGEVVEKQAARRVYEDFLHRRQDPALLEQAAGNEFSARVFPIPPQSSKDLIVSYSQEIGPGAPYSLQLRGLPEVARVDAVVSAGGDGSVLDQIHLERAVPERDLRVTEDKMPELDGLRAEELVLLRVKPGAPVAGDPLKSLLVLVDTSASRALGFEDQTALVAAIVAQLDPATPLALAAFDQGIDLIYEGRASGFGAAGPALLRQRQAFGASDLELALRWAGSKAASSGAKRVLLVSDGVPTRGVLEPPALCEIAKGLAGSGVERLDAVAVGGIRDDALLRQIVRSGLSRDGVVVDALRGSREILQRLSSGTQSVGLTLEGATWQWPVAVESIQPNDVTLLYAEVPAGVTPRLRIGDLSLEAAKLQTVDRPLLERAWAQAKIAQLLANPENLSAEEAKREIVRLSTTHRVLSPHTALLVLESERDYASYSIDRKALTDILRIDGNQIVHAKRSEDLLPEPNPAAPKVETPQGVPEPTWQNLWGDTIGDAFGAGGLGRSGVGKGGGRSAGLELEGIASSGPRSEYAPGGGLRDNAKRSVVPQIRMGKAKVEGRLPTEVVQRIVRQSYKRFRLCYENSLRASPTLAGSVTTRFVIGRDGSVTNVQTMKSELRDSAVVQCLLRTFYGLSFPKPEGGIVVVDYSMVFSPEAPSPSSAEASPPAPPAPPLPTPGADTLSEVEPYEGKMAEVMKALAAGDKDTALAKAIGYRNENPGDVLALVALGEALEARGELRSAARAYGSLIDLYSSRADLRRMAGERLERLGTRSSLLLAADSYRKAVSQRPDHPAGHRLLAYALLRAGDPAGAFAALTTGRSGKYPRFPGADQILSEDLALLGAAWIKADPSKRKYVEDRLREVGVAPETKPSLRFVLVWETDNNDVDFHIYDSKGGHAYHGSKELASGGKLYADVRTGYGPECFTVPLGREQRAGPHRLQAHYYSRGPMGYGMGKLEIIDHDGSGGLTFEERPFVVMRDRAFLELGFYPAQPLPADAGQK